MFIIEKNGKRYVQLFCGIWFSQRIVIYASVQRYKPDFSKPNLEFYKAFKASSVAIKNKITTW